MANEKKYVIEVNCITNEETKREYTAEEYALSEELKLAHEARQAQEDLEAKATAEAKASALAKLAELGLTEDEVKAIAG